MSESSQVLQGFFVLVGREKGKRKIFKGNRNFMEAAEVLMKLLRCMDFR